jgi:peptidoglycan hydrolase-like protein with peptidoglycan-binding domain/subtilisin family serine protease
MDPALWEALDGDEGHKIEAIVRLAENAEPPAGVRLVACFGEIATCRLRRADIVDVHEAAPVRSLKASRLVVPELAWPDPAGDVSSAETWLSGDSRRPDSLTATGRGILVGAVDWGCDFAHPDLRRADGSTRLLGLWDQRGGQDARSPEPYGYGRFYTAEEIDGALRSSDPYAALGYHPADADPDGTGAHGTHVLTIAAGNGAGGGPAGMAPDADLVFVHLAGGEAGQRTNLGSSVTLLEGVHLISELAGERPCVVNASVGRHGGPHDGSTLVEQGLNHLVSHRPGRCVVQSCGNYFHRDTHARGRLMPGSTRTLRWRVDPADRTPNELEIWYSGHDRFSVEIAAGVDGPPVRLELGESAPLHVDGREAGHAYHRARDPNNNRHHVDIFVGSAGPLVSWEIRLIGEDVADGRFHAWVERDATCRGCQSRFNPDDSDPQYTIGTIANGLRTIAVGAYDAHAPDRTLADFSSSGPTVDGRQKPECLAPGVRVLAARSMPASGATEPGYVRMSGTSMAAPYVAGTVACMYEAAGRPLPIEQLRAAIAEGSERMSEGVSSLRAGAGYLDPLAAVGAVRRTAHPEVTNDITARTEADDPMPAHVSPSWSAEDALGADVPCGCSGQTRDGDGVPVGSAVLEEIAGERDGHGQSAEAGDTESWDDEYDEGIDLVRRVHEAIGAHALNSPTDLLSITFGTESNLRPADLFRLALRGAPPQGVEVVASPGTLVTGIRAGDVVVRHSFEGDLAHAFMVASDRVVTGHSPGSSHYPTESAIPGIYVEVLDPSSFHAASGGRVARRIADRSGRMPYDQVVLRLPPWTDGDGFDTASDIPGPHECLPGEGPPQALPDPQGRGAHPLVYRGGGAMRSRNPTVGHAQRALNRWLTESASRSPTCADASPGTSAYISALREELRRNGQDPLIVDCRFGANTERATKMFQACHGLERDGKIGPITWSYLRRYALNSSGRINPPDTATCGVPARPAQELEAELDAELSALLEAPAQPTVRARLSLFQNSSISSHRNHFQCQAVRTARRLRAYADPRSDACTPRRVGATAYDTGMDIITAISAAHRCMGRRLEAIHIFGHSGSHGVFGTTLGTAGLYVNVDPSSRTDGGREVADVPVDALADDVVMVLHGCNLAAGTDNFARALYNHLATTLSNPRVYGHHNGGCAGRDNSWREYSNRHPTGRNVRSIAPHYSGDGCCSSGGEASDVVVLESLGEALLHECRPGEGPPASVPDPEGKGLHPLVYRGVTQRRSRNPTVGHAQILLNRFLDATRADFGRCDERSPETLQFIRTLRAQLQRNGQDPLAVDCRFGTNTDLATKMFQACVGLTRDGKIGPATWSRLEAFGQPVSPPRPAPSPLPAPVFTPPPPPNPPFTRPTFRPCCLLEPGSLVDAASIGGHGSDGGIIYTGKAGFVDIGHVRDIADLTAFVYQQIHGASGAAGTRISTTEGVAVLNTAVPPGEWLEVARSVSFDDSLGHEIASYHTIVPGGHNSAFSPEDLCSNFLGTLVAARALTGGNFPAEVERQIQSLLASLDAQSLKETRAAFALINGRWVVRGLLGIADPRYLRRRNFTRTPFKAGHASDSATPAFVTAAFSFSGSPYDYTHTIARRFTLAQFPAEIAVIRADARSKYGPDFDQP